MAEDIKVNLSEGKYTVVIPDRGGLHVLRHGEPWMNEHDLCGNNLVYNLAYELHQARESIKALREVVLSANKMADTIIDGGQVILIETEE